MIPPVNIFLTSSALQVAISVIGVLVFVGLTALDTQRIKELAAPHAEQAGACCTSWQGLNVSFVKKTTSQ